MGQPAGAPWEASSVGDAPISQPDEPAPSGLHRSLAVLERSLGGPVTAAIGGLARDVTAEICTGHLLVVAPHPDDETLACGGTVLRTLAEGGRVSIAVATDGRYGDPRVDPARMAEIRAGELERAAGTLGIGPGRLVRMGFEDASLSANEGRLADELARLVRELRPDVVLGPCSWDLHPDHAALGRALATLSDGGPRLFGYLVWGWARPVRLAVRAVKRATAPGGRPRLPRRPVAVGVAAQLDAKAVALAAHSSQLSPDAALAGRAVGGTGPLGAEFLLPFGTGREIFFPLRRG